MWPYMYEHLNKFYVSDIPLFTFQGKPNNRIWDSSYIFSPFTITFRDPNKA